MIASEPQRRHNEKRIHSIQHMAHVLDAAHINQPGIAITHHAMEDVEQSNIQSSSNEITVIDATDLHMQDPIPPMPEQLVEQEIYQPCHNGSLKYNIAHLFLPWVHLKWLQSCSALQVCWVPPCHISYPQVNPLKAENHSNVLYVKLQGEMV